MARLLICKCRTMPCLMVAAFLLVQALFVLGCEDTKEVVINAEDVTYGESGGTVGDTLDRIEKNQGTKAHTHKATEITGFDSAAVNAMGVKTNTNPLKHDRYGETDLKASATIKALQSADSALNSRVAKLEGGTPTPTGTECPSGYTLDKTVTTFTLCKKGSDQMVKVGDYWIDRYETMLKMKADCTGSPTSAGWQVTGFSEKARWTSKLYACSVTDTTYKPSGMTYFQAQMACNNVGKHLCTHAEWQNAAAGTDPIKSNLNNSLLRRNGETTASSVWGADNMIGNVYEWGGGLVFNSATTTKALLKGGSRLETSASIDQIKRVDQLDQNVLYGARCCISGK